MLLTSLVSYKNTLGRLKAMRTEIEHLQLLSERVKVKIQKDFQKWWSQEATNPQVTDLSPIYVHFIPLELVLL